MSFKVIDTVCSLYIVSIVQFRNCWRQSCGSCHQLCGSSALCICAFCWRL